MYRARLRIFCHFLLIGLLFALTSCPAAQEDTTPAAVPVSLLQNYGGTQAPGDYWEWTINREANTFTGNNYGTTLGVTLQKTYSGTFTDIDSGFMKMTVTSTDDTTATNAIAYGVEFPGTAILCLPAGPNPNLIAGTAKGSFSFAANTRFFWMALPGTGFNIETSVTHGVSIINSVSGNTLVMQIAPSLFSPTPNPDPLLPPEQLDQSYKDGIFEGDKIFLYPTGTNTNPESIITMMPSGGFMVDSGTGGGYFGTVQAATPTDYDELMTREFRGFETTYAEPATRGTRAVWLRTSGDVMNLGSHVEPGNPESAETTTGFIPINFKSYTQSTENPGYLMPTALCEDNLRWNYRLTVSKVNGKYMILGFGRDDGLANIATMPNRTVNEYCNLFLIEK